MIIDRSNVEIFNLHMESSGTSVRIFKEVTDFNLICQYGNFNFKRLNVRRLNMLSIVIVIENIALEFSVATKRKYLWQIIQYERYFFLIEVEQFKALKKFLNS